MNRLQIPARTYSSGTASAAQLRPQTIMPCAEFERRSWSITWAYGCVDLGWLSMFLIELNDENKNNNNITPTMTTTTLCYKACINCNKTHLKSILDVPHCVLFLYLHFPGFQHWLHVAHRDVDSEQLLSP